MEAQKLTLNSGENNNISNREYKFSLNETNYLIRIGGNSEQLIINVRQASSVSKIFYEESLTLEQLQKLSRSFRYYDNINEAISNIYEIFENKKFSIQKDNNNICLIIKLNKGISGEENVNIGLRAKNNSIQNVCENLCEEIIVLKNKINELEKKNQELEDKFDKKIQMIKEENKRKDIIIEELVKWKKEKDEIDKENKEWKNTIDSKIITKKEEIDFISDRIQNTDILKKKKLTYKLIFRGTRDGTQSIHFHQKCDGIGPTISIIQTIKGYKFGGYAEKNWSKEGNKWIYDDENAFIFSLNHMKIYNPIKGKEKYYFGEDYGPNFYSFWPKKDMFATSGNYVHKKDIANQYFSGFLSDYELNGGEQYFITQELEVFQIIFT